MKRFLSILLCILTLALAIPAHTAFAAEEEYVHQQKFSADHQLTGLFSSLEESFQVGDWELRQATLTLSFSVTPLLIQDVSDLTLTLNGQKFYSGRIPQATAEVQQMEIPLPVDVIAAGINTLVLETYIRTNESDPCRDDVSTGNWMRVLADSSVSIRYTPKNPCDTVADFYRGITSIDALENGQSAVCIPTNAGAVELTAAGLAVSGISGGAQLSYDRIALEQTDSAPQNYKYALYLSQFSSLPAQLASLLSEEQKNAIQQGNCVMALLKPAPGRNLLLMTGPGDALLRSGQALGSGAFAGQINREWTAISPTQDVLTRQDGAKMTASLTQSGSYVKGPFRQSASFFIQNPANRQIDHGSGVQLAFRYAENLDFNRSMVTVYIDDTPIGSKKLTKQGAQGDSAYFAIPQTLAITGAFTVKAAFDLEIPDLNCTERRDEMPWAYVTNESAITLQTKETSSLLFEHYPSPFVADGRFNDLVVMLPDHPDAADLQAYRGVMATLGRFVTDNSGSMRVALYADAGELGDRNVIAIGRYENNTVAQELNKQLYFQFSPKGTTILPNEKKAIEPNYGATLGSAQLLYSPFGKDKGLLLISGVTDEGMLRSAAYLSRVDDLWKVYGDGFIADGETSYSYRFKPDNAKTATFFEKLLSRKDLLLLVALSAGVIAALLGILVMLNVRNRRKRNDEQAK